MPRRCPRPSLAIVAGLVLMATACSDAGPEEDAPERPSGTSPSARGPQPSASALDATPTPTPGPTLSRRSLSTDQQDRLDERLIAAAWRNDLRAVRRLLDLGADLDRRDATQQNTFLIAASEGYAELLGLAVRRGADVTLHDSFDGTALIRAAERGHWRIVGRLLQPDLRQRSDPDHVNNLGWTALHEAVVLGEGTADDAATVRVLAAGGVDLKIPSVSSGRTPLLEAVARDQATVVATLRRAQGPAPAAPDRALLRAAASGDADGVAVALRAGADLEARDGQGRTPLLLAATGDHVSAAQVLLALGASPDSLDDRHDTPWLVTGVTGSVAMAETMLPFRPDLGVQNRFGGLSLIPAAERGHVDYVRLVSRSGIDVDHVNDLGWTALLEAVILGDGSARYVEIVRLLLDAGADPAIADRDGVTAVEHARSRGHEAVARALGG